MNTQNLQLQSKTLRSDAGLVCFKVDLVDGNEVLQSKTMSIDDYITLISGAERRTERPITVALGEIPEGMVDGYASPIEGTLGAIIRVPAHKQQFSLTVDKNISESGVKSFFMPLPNLIYLITYSSGVRKSFDCYCYKEWEGLETKLMQYPFGNVSSSGSICMGKIVVDEEDKTSFMGLRRIIESSLYGITNNDYLTDGRVRLKERYTQYDFCKKLVDENVDVFPHELLLEQPGNLITVADLQKKLNGV